MEIFIIILIVLLSFYGGKFYGERKIPEISIKYAIDELKMNIVGLIVFYQSKYDESDQIVLIKKWLDSIDKKNIDPAQLDLFKKYVEEF